MRASDARATRNPEFWYNNVFDSAALTDVLNKKSARRSALSPPSQRAGKVTID